MLALQCSPTSAFSSHWDVYMSADGGHPAIGRVTGCHQDLLGSFSVLGRGALERLTTVGGGGGTRPLDPPPPGPGHVGFSLRGGGVNRAPKSWGGGVQEKGSIDRHH